MPPGGNICNAFNFLNLLSGNSNGYNRSYINVYSKSDGKLSNGFKD